MTNDSTELKIPPPALQVTGLTKSYGGHKILDQLDLKLPPASLVGLLGPNGAGKTTLLKALAGLISPANGRVQVAGYDLRKHEAEVRGKLAYVPDVPHFYVELTVLEHLELIARAHKALIGFEERAERLLRRFGIWEVRHNPSFALSRGQTQKLAICCAFIRPSEVLLLDEPGGTLDIKSVMRLYGMLTDYRQAGGLALLSSHQWESLQTLCDMFVLIDQGQVLAVGALPFLREAASLSPEASLREIYLAFLEGQEADQDDETDEEELEEADAEQPV